MSYILDALRKSDQMRQRGAAPTLLTTHVPAMAPKQTPFVLYGLLAVALVGVGVLVGWLRPWQMQQPAPAPAPITLDTVRKEAQEIPIRKSDAAAQPAPAPAPVGIEPRGTASNAPVSVANMAAAPEKPGARPADAGQEQRVMNISELPPAIQQAIPRMSIAVHAYSPKLQERVVMINNQMMHEGQDLVPGLKLEQITPDGMVFSFSGYRFRRGLQQSGESAEMK